MTHSITFLKSGDYIEQWLENEFYQNKKSYYRYLAMLALINIMPLAREDLSKVWTQNNIRHSYAIYRTPIVLAYNQNPADIDYAAATYAAASAVNVSSGLKLFGVGEVAHAANSKSTASAAVSISVACKDAYEAISDEFYASSFIALSWLVLAKKIQNPKDYREYDALLEHFKPLVIAGIKPLLDIGLDYLYQDLLILIESLFGRSESQIAKKHLEGYFKKLDLSAFVTLEILRETLFGKTDKARVRVLLIGSGGSGKTSLFQLLSGDTVKSNNTATTNINRCIISDVTTKWKIYDTSKPTQNIDISLWDFAGQTQYYGLHQSFFNNRCLYILVIDSRHQQSPYDWLQQIELLSDNQEVQVLILINNYENCPSQLNISDIQGRFERLKIDESSVFEVNLGAFIGKSIQDKEVIDWNDDKEYDRLLSFLKTLVTKSEKVQTQMSTKILDFYNDIDRMLENNKYCFSTRELRRIAQQYDQVDTYKGLIKAFGNLVETKQREKVTWLSAQWLNQAGYELLHTLQSGESKGAYEHDYIIDEIERNPNAKINEKSFDDLLTHFYYSSLAVSSDASSKIIFPAILSINDPEYVMELNNPSQYFLFASFDIQIDFMQMGLFSQWLVEWLNKSKDSDRIELKEGWYSRHCCILSSSSDSNAAQMLVKWHPHYQSLTFFFYYPVAPSFNSQKEKEYLDDFSELLYSALNTIFSEQRIDKRNFQGSLLMGDEFQINRDMTRRFVHQLSDITKKGIIYHCFMQSASKGDIKVEKNYYAKNQTNIDENIGTTQTADVINNYSVDSAQQSEFIEALTKLELKYYKENIDEPKKVEIVTKVIDAAKLDIKTGELDEKKKSVLETIVKGIDSANPIIVHVSGLFAIYGVIAGII